MRYSFFIMLISLAASNTARSQWEVENDHQEEFTIRVWNDRDPQNVGVKVVPANSTRKVPLVRDAHRIQAISSGGYAYFFRPRELNGQSTKLSVLITPDRKRNGVQTYKYMNQQGYRESDYSDDLQRISRSDWKSTYVVIETQDQRQDASLRLRGGSGTYGNQGTLRNVRYRPGKEPGSYVVDGTWHFGNVNGRFEFTFNDDSQFDGRYTYNNKVYSWTGTRD